MDSHWCAYVSELSSLAESPTCTTGSEAALSINPDSPGTRTWSTATPRGSWQPMVFLSFVEIVEI